jgi:hypothetical protein
MDFSIRAFLFYSCLCKLISLQILEGRHPISSGKKKAVEVLINIRILKFVLILGYGTLYVTYPVFSSNIDGLYGVILPVFFMSVKS